jgi:hypothetical protein
MRRTARVDRAGQSATMIHGLHSTFACAHPTAARVPYARSRTSVRIRGALTLRERATLALRAARFPDASPLSRQRNRAWTDLSARSAISTVQSLRQTRVEFRRTLIETVRETSRIHSRVPRTWRAAQEAACAEETHASPHLQALMLKRPAELVWRANAGATMTSNDAAGKAIASASARFAAAPPPSRKPNATVVCATALDPALADRVAADVIRRIDRRARIERERRGP